MDYTIIGQRIADYRRKRGYTQQYLAEAADISHTYVSHIECGRKCASLATIIRLAGALDVRIEQILTEDDSDDQDGLLSEIQELLDNTTPEERFFLLETMKVVKRSFEK